MLTFDVLQSEVSAWVKRNFGDQRGWEPLLGVIEETGELAHCQLKEHQQIRGSRDKHVAGAKDAVGDVLVYLADYTHFAGIPLGAACGYETPAALQSAVAQAYSQEDGKHPPTYSWSVALYLGAAVGELCEAHTDHPQGPDTLAGTRVAVRGVLHALAEYCHVRGFDLQQVVESVWGQVKLRDWKRDPSHGGESAPSNPSLR